MGVYSISQTIDIESKSGALTGAAHVLRTRKRGSPMVKGAGECHCPEFLDHLFVDTWTDAPRYPRIPSVTCTLKPHY